MAISINLIAALTFALISGVASGSCMAPMKFLRRWRWENMWLLFSVVALLVIPWSLAMLWVPHLWFVYRNITLARCAPSLIFGLGWGFSQALFGLTIARLGLSLGYAIVMGFVCVLGTSAPLLAQPKRVNVTNLFAIVLMAVGIVLVGLAGRRREMFFETADGTKPNATYHYALLLAIACGLLSPMLNYSFAFAGSLRAAAIASGASPNSAGYAVWPVALSAGFLPNAFYCLYLLNKNRSWNLFRAGFFDAALSIAMGAMWMASLACYSVCAARLGDLGTSLGWGIVQIFSLLTACALGRRWQEWKSVRRTTRGIRSVGLLLLIGAIFVMAIAAQ